MNLSLNSQRQSEEVLKSLTITKPMNKKAGLIFTLMISVVVFILGVFVGVWVVNNLVDVPFFSPPEDVLNSPGDFISDKDIVVYSDKVLLNIPNAKITSYDSTGSMKPVLDEGANGIVIVPESADEIDVGDIVSYKSGEELIVHRVIEKNQDGGGVYFVVKGDNSPTTEIIRFSQIEHKVVGVLY